MRSVGGRPPGVLARDPMAPRIDYAPPTGHDAEVQELMDLAAAGTGGAQNIFLMFANHPGLFRRFMPFGGKLLAGGKLPPRERELAILRTAVRCDCVYEWGQHVRIGRSSGVAEDDFGRLLAGPDADGWREADAHLLRAVDQLVADHDIDQATWDGLAATYDDKQMLELTILVGNYAMLAGLINATGVEPEDGLPTFADFA